MRPSAVSRGAIEVAKDGEEPDFWTVFASADDFTVLGHFKTERAALDLREKVLAGYSPEEVIDER